MKAYLSLGGNLGDRAYYLREARARLSASVQIVSASGIYETEPWGSTDQPDFWNQVLEIETGLAARDLLAFCQGIETRLGRERTERWGARTIDIDLLFYEQMICQSPELTLPHPRIENREFVLAPLREIAPTLMLPSGRPVLEHHGFGRTRKVEHVPLDREPWDLDERVFAQALKTKELGRSFFIFDQLASTIVQAKEAISHDEPAGVTILARRQIAGIGRQRRAWISPRGGLWLSVVLRPQLPLEDAAKMTLCAAVAAVSAIEQCCGLCLGIKWPNDLLWQGHKVAGILAETVGEWTQRHTLIMSLGLNVNIPAQDLLEASSAISLQMILQRPVNINHLAAVFLECLEKDMCVLEEDGFESIRQAWLDRALGIGEEVVIYRGDQEFRGVMRGIAKDGCLLVSIGQQEVSFAAGEVTLHPQYSSS